MPLKQDASEFLSVRYNRLTVIKDLGFAYAGTGRRVLAGCDCGVIKEYFFSSLKNGNTVSCGCYKDQIKYTLNYSHGLSRTPIYKLWVAVKQRCYNKNHESYPNYGGRGVKMCDEWKNNFKAFYDWCIKNGWGEGLQLDKDKLSPIRPGNTYCPEYCCFLTPAENSKYTSSNNIIVYNGISKSLNEWCVELGLRYGAISHRILRGWNANRAFETPVGNYNKQH